MTQRSWFIYSQNIIPLISVMVANNDWMNRLSSADTASCVSKETYSSLPYGGL